jgi:hypothetical protein
MSMSELESGSATVGGGRGDAIILTFYVLVGLCFESGVVLSGATRSTEVVSKQ